jgi:hypothetical protein
MRKTIRLNSWIWWWCLAAASWGGLFDLQMPLNRPPAALAAGQLACIDTINITLDENCEANLTPDKILSGDWGCSRPEDFLIRVIDHFPENGPRIDGPGVFRYEIRRLDGACAEGEFSHCHGVVRAEDKSPPRLECPTDTDKAIADLAAFIQQETLDKRDASLNAIEEICFPADARPLPGKHYYDLFRFQVIETNFYILEVKAEWGEVWAGLYQNEFNPFQPCRRLLQAARPVKDGAGCFPDEDGVYRIAMILFADKDYVLFTSSRQPEQMGDYTWAMLSYGEFVLKGQPKIDKSVVFPLFCSDAELVLNEESTIDIFGDVTAIDDCDGFVDLSFSDRLLLEANADRIVERTFQASDKSGNTDTCIQRIRFRQPTLADVILPPEKVFFHCDEFFSIDENGNPDPYYSGIPFIWTASGPLFLTETSCDIGASYRDGPPLFICENTAIIYRDWKIVDWRQGERTLNFRQIITIGDFVGPSFSCPKPEMPFDDGLPELRYSTGPFSCFAAFEIPLPNDIVDNCSQDWHLEVQVLRDGEDKIAVFPPGAANYYVTGVPTGVHRFRYIVKDQCNNTTVRECEFMVSDAIQPVAICVDSLHISLDGKGRARITSKSVDEGSWDNCDPDPELKIRRSVAPECVEAYKSEVDTFLFLDKKTGLYFTPWRDHLDIICREAGKRVVVELRVTDRGGLSNICWMEARIEDKIPPQCHAPPDVSLPCDSLPYLTELDTSYFQALFGMAEASDNCSARVFELPPLLDLDRCGVGAIIRRFQAEDASGNRSQICTQRIHLTLRHNYEIKFPKDAFNKTCGDTTADTLEYRTLGCDLLAINRDTTYFEAEAEECFKMVIRYRVINWCEFKEGGSPVVVGRDENASGKPGDEPVYVLRRAHTTYIDNNNNERDGFFRIVDSKGFWEYTQIVKVFDTIPPEVEFFGNERPFCSFENDCDAEVNILFDVIENCASREAEYSLVFDENDDGRNRMDLDVRLFILGRFPKQRISGRFPIGKHSFILTVTDGCANTTIVKIPFEVVDCKFPAPVCIERLAVELGAVDSDGDGQVDGGANTVWATDFIVRDIDDCSGPVRYSISRVGEVPHPDSISLTITCADPEILPVQITAWDNAFNPEFIQPDGTLGGPNFSGCITFIHVQDNQFNLCGRVPARGSIAGRISTEDGLGVANVEVNLSGQATRVRYSDEDGRYDFPLLLEGYDYTVYPRKDENFLNGVTTFDLVLISKHILGVQPLSSPYRLIAADVNRSGSITTLDLLLVRRAILGIDKRFPNNTSWRFIPRSFAFPDPENPWKTSFPEIFNINDLFGDESALDFVAVKVGDVNGSAKASSGAIQPRERGESFELHAHDQVALPGESINVDIYALDMRRTDAFQFTLDFDPAALRLADIAYGWVNEEQVHAGEGAIAVAWHRAPGASVDEGASLFSLRFTALKTARLSENLRLSSRVTTAAAYDDQGLESGAALRFTPPGANVAITVENYPNPWREATRVRFYVPKAETVTLKVQDLNGRILHLRQGAVEAGYNEWILTSREVKSQGVLILSIESAGGVAVGRMLATGE